VLTLHLNSANVETLNAGVPRTDRDRICEISGTALQDRRGRRGEEKEDD
jgi:hypothetical protein